MLKILVILHWKDDEILLEVKVCSIQSIYTDLSCSVNDIHISDGELINTPLPETFMQFVGILVMLDTFKWIRG